MGAWTIPSTGCPSSMRPMDTDQSGWPAAKALVPSMGSTIHTRRLLEPDRVVGCFLGQPGGVRQKGRQVVLQERVHRDVGLGDGGTPFLEP